MRKTDADEDFCFGSFFLGSTSIDQSSLATLDWSCTTTLTAQAWAGPTSIPRGAVWGGSSTYGFEAEPFQQWGLGTDMMIGLGRAAGLLRAPVGISVWDRDPQTDAWDSPLTWE